MVAANKQKMFRGDHDFPSQILRPLPYNHPRLAIMGVLLVAKIRWIFLQLPGSLSEVNMVEMFDSPAM